MQTLTLDQCPEDVRAHFLAMPAFQNAMQITKSERVNTGSQGIVTKTLKTGLQHVRKAAYSPPFAQILAGSVSRNTGDTPPTIQQAPAPNTAPTDAALTRANTQARPEPIKSKPQAFNTPKQPANTSPAAAGLGDPISFKDLRAAIDTAMNKDRDEAKARAFNEARSAFSRITKTQEHHVQGGGSGDAWSLRNFGGRLAASVLGNTAQKGETKPVGSSALEVAFGRGR